MKARATSPGFYRGARVKAGQVFDIAEGSKGSWFEVLPEEKQTAPQRTQVKARTKPDASV